MCNKHILDYLNYYVDLPNPPQYAVMLTGPWGVGKSYEIKQYVKTLAERGKKVAYVSLYGIKSTEDISIAILTALVPKQDSKLFKLGSQLGRALLKKLPLIHEAGLPDWVAESMCDLLVLDDLERAILSPVEVLGFVNTFIEHEGRRVVIVANESEIADKDNYKRVREKVIGMTFEFVEQSANALNHFIECTEDEAIRTFFKSAVDTIFWKFLRSLKPITYAFSISRCVPGSGCTNLSTRNIRINRRASRLLSNCSSRCRWRCGRAALGVKILPIALA